MTITTHFSLEEFACHDGTPYPQDKIESCLRPLCLGLEEVRSLFGRPLHIISGYRTPKYNRKIRGARSSRHMYGDAADFRVDGIVIDEVQRLIAVGLDRSTFPRFGGFGRYQTFTHLDMRPRSPHGGIVRWTTSVIGARDAQRTLGS